MGSSIKAGQQNPHAPRRRTRQGSAVPAPSQGHVAARLRTPPRGSLRGRTVCRRRAPHPRRKAADPDRQNQTERDLLGMTETQDIPPAETAGTEITRFNALKHGVLSRYTVLPWGGRRRIPRPGVISGGRASSAGADRGAPGRGTGGHPVAQTAAASCRGRCLSARP